MKGVSEKLITVMKAVIIADIVTLVGGVTYLTMPTPTSVASASVSVSADYTGTEIGDSSSESSELDDQPIREVTVESEADESDSNNNPHIEPKHKGDEEDIVYTVYKDKTSSRPMPEEPPQIEECVSYVPVETYQQPQQPSGTIITPPYWWSNTRMSYMDFRTITDQTSDQWALQQSAYTDPETGIRMVAGRYCVAVGSAITTEKGALMNVTLQNGITIPCILADCKQDSDTIDTLVGADGGIIEFVVTTEMLPGDVQLMGSNEAQFNYLWQSPVESIFLYDSTGSNGDDIVW